VAFLGRICNSEHIINRNAQPRCRLKNRAPGNQPKHSGTSVRMWMIAALSVVAGIPAPVGPLSYTITHSAMEISEKFSHDLIKGKIAELVFELMFREAGKFTPLRFGYEYTVPELAQYRNLVGVEEVLNNISNSPDFILISKPKNGSGRVEVFTVEVKYRTHPNPQDAAQVAAETLKTWNPSWLFIASPEGFFFAPCSSIIRDAGVISPLSDNWVSKELKAKYLELLRDFELGH
jgi:hypothetical protein